MAKSPSVDVSSYASIFGKTPTQPAATKQTPAPSKSTVVKVLNFLKNTGEAIAQPITSGVGAAVRDIQAAPQVAKQGVALLTGNKKAAAQANQKAQATMNKPIFGQPNYNAMTPKQDIGSAAKVASFLTPELGLGGKVTSFLAGASQLGGQAAVDKKSGGTIAAASGLGGLLGVGTDAALGVGSNLIDRLKGASSGLGSDVDTALDAIKTKMTPEERASAAQEPKPVLNKDGTIQGSKPEFDENGNLKTPKQLRGTVKPNGSIDLGPSVKDAQVAKTLEPLVKNGDIVSPKTPEDHLNNLSNTQKALDTSVSKLRSGLKALGTDGWDKNDLLLPLRKVEVPPLLQQSKGVADSILNIAEKSINDADKANLEGALDAKQSFDRTIKQKFPNLYTQDMTPVRQYVSDIRDSLSDSISKKLPDGKLPDGTPLRDEWRKQSNLINAREQMGQKSAESHLDVGRMKRWALNNPEKARLLRRVGYTVGGGAVGLYAAGTAIHKLFQ